MDHIESIKVRGFTVLADLIDADQCERFKSNLEDHYQRYSRHYASNSIASTHGLDNKTGEKVVYNLHNKGRDWFELFDHPRVINVLDTVLTEASYKNADPYYLNNISARCPKLGSGEQQLHIDSRVAGLNHPLVVNVIWMLDDFTELNGATRVVPGSHRYNSFAPDGERHHNEVLVTGRKGSAMIFDAGLWHGGSNNMSGESRWALALGYARWFVKPAFDYVHNTPPELFGQLSERQQRLLGFDSLPPMDEFTRVRRRSEFPEPPRDYRLPV
ncbi:MAG: phytanoyl-CoA dioxygenase family protein [Pseudomonadota bacterium]